MCLQAVSTCRYGLRCAVLIRDLKVSAYTPGARFCLPQLCRNLLLLQRPGIIDLQVSSLSLISDDVCCSCRIVLPPAFDQIPLSWWLRETGT